MANCRDHNHRFMYAIDALLIVIAVIISSALANLKKRQHRRTHSTRCRNKAKMIVQSADE